MRGRVTLDYRSQGARAPHKGHLTRGFHPLLRCSRHSHRCRRRHHHRQDSGAGDMAFTGELELPEEVPQIIYFQRSSGLRAHDSAIFIPQQKQIAQMMQYANDVGYGGALTDDPSGNLAVVVQLKDVRPNAEGDDYFRASHGHQISVVTCVSCEPL